MLKTTLYSCNAYKYQLEILVSNLISFARKQWLWLNENGAKKMNEYWKYYIFVNLEIYEIILRLSNFSPPSLMVFVTNQSPPGDMLFLNCNNDCPISFMMISNNFYEFGFYITFVEFFIYILMKLRIMNEKTKTLFKMK